MRPGGIVLGILMLLLAGCGGGPPLTLEPLLRELRRHEEDARALGTGAAAARILQAAEQRRDEVAHLAPKEVDALSLLRLETAIADIRLAVAMSVAQTASRDAQRCRAAVAEGRQGLEAALRQLAASERAAEQSGWVMLDEVPGLDALALPAFPAGTFPQDSLMVAAPGTLDAAWSEWRAAAIDLGVPVGVLEGRFRVHLAAARAPETEVTARPYHLHVAGRALQELEVSARAAAHRRICLLAVPLAEQLGAARDGVLRTALDLERGLTGELQTALEDSRVQAENRQNQLYGALQQLEGEFARISQEARGTIISLADILFDFDEATLKRDVEFNLVRVATILNQFPEMRIQVEGHTDNVGQEEYNQRLSQRRAQAVYDFLATQRVAAARMTVRGYGHSRPVADNATAAGRQRNRRVDLVIQDQP